MKTLLANIQQLCLSTKELKTALVGEAPPTLSQINGALSALANAGQEVLNYQLPLPTKGTAIASDVRIMVNKLAGLQNGVAEKLLSPKDVTDMVVALTSESAQAVYVEANRLAAMVQEVMVEPEVEPAAKVVGKFTSFQDMKAATDQAQAAVKKTVISTSVLREGTVESADDYNRAALSRISSWQTKTQTALRTAAKKITNVTAPELEDRFAVNYSATQKPGDWWFGTVTKIGNGGGVQITFDSDPEDPANFTAKQAMSGLFAKLKKSAPSTTKGVSYTTVSKYSDGDLEEKTISTVVVVEHVAIVPGMPAKRPPPYDDKWLKENDAVQTILSLEGGYDPKSNKNLSNDEVGFVVLNEQRIMMFHEAAAAAQGAKLNKSQIDEHKRDDQKAQARALLLARRKLDKDLVTHQEAETEMLADIEKKSKAKKAGAIKVDDLKLLLGKMRSMVAERKRLAGAIFDAQSEEEKNGVNPKAGEIKALSKKLEANEAAIEAFREKNAKHSPSLKLLEGIQNKIAETMEAIDLNQESVDKLRQFQINQNALQQAPSTQHESGYHLAQSVLDNLNAKTHEKFVLVSPVSKRGLPHTLLCYWIATEHEYQMLISNFDFPADANGILEWQFINTGKAPEQQQRGSAGRESTYQKVGLKDTFGDMSETDLNRNMRRD